jgi:hypothetical protein
MRLVIEDDYDAVSTYVAEYVKKRILEFKPTAERPFVLGTCSRLLADRSAAL